MKTIKFLIFIPMSILAFVVINFLFMRLLNWTIEKTVQWYGDLHLFYYLLLLPLFWGTIWGVFKLSAIGLAALLIPVSPQKKFSLYSLSAISAINTLALVLYYWTRDIHYSWKIVFMTFIVTVFTLDFSISILLVFAKKENLYVQ